MSGTTPPPPPNDQNISDNIFNVKEKIISSGKLLKVLTRSKKDIESKIDENSDLRAKILSLEGKLSSKEDEIVKTINKNQHLEKEFLSLKQALQERDALKNTPLSKEEDVKTIKTLREELSALEKKNSDIEKALTSKNMYTTQLEAECESLKKEKTDTGSSKLRQDLTKKTQEIKSLNSQIKDLNEKLTQVNVDNETYDMENLALKMEFDEVQHLLTEATENVAELKTKLEQETARVVDTKQSYTREVNITKSLKERIQALKEEQDGLKAQLQEERLKAQLQEERLKAKLQEEKLKAANVTKYSSANSSIAINPKFMDKIKILKADYNLLKSENKFLKAEIQKKDLKLSKRQNLEALLQSSSSEDDSEDMDIDVNARSSRSKSSSSSASRSSISKPSTIMDDPYSIDLDPLSPGNEPLPPIAPTEYTPISSPIKEKSVILAKSTKGGLSSRVTSSPKAESSNRTTSTVKGKAAFRNTGLEVPPPKIPAPTATTSAKPKKTTSKLAKFANSRNPSKVIDSRPLISHTPRKRALSPEKPVPSETSSASPVRERSLSLGTKPVSTQLPRSSESSSTSVVMNIDAQSNKKSKLNTFYADSVKEWINANYMVSNEEFNEENINKCLEEIKLNYVSMKSASDPDSKGSVVYGIYDRFIIEVPNKTDSREKAYAWILSLTANRKPIYFKRIYCFLYEEFKVSLKSKRPDTTCARYARLICTICKSTNALERIRTVCYDIIRQSTCPKNSIICLYNIASGWKDSLTMTSTKNMTMDALQVCCNVIAHDKKTPVNIKTMYEKMANLCNWSNTIEKVKLETAIQNVYDEFTKLENEKDTVILRRKCFQVLKSFELIFNIMNCWKKLYNKFILEKMWPLLSNDNLSEMAIEIMATLGTFGLSANPSKPDKPGVEQLFELMIQVFTVDNSLSGIQATALKGAYMLSIYDADRLTKVKICAKSIIN